MASAGYSFIDIAALDPVRRRFAAGEAIVVLSTDLDEVLWANGPGARVFGYADVEAIMAAEAAIPAAARRQIAATAGYPSFGAPRALTLRIASWFSSAVQPLSAEAVVLPGGEAAILLAQPAPAEATADEIAARTVLGFRGDGSFAAVIDGGGAVLAATPGFGDLNLSGATLAALAADTAREPDRRLKRLVPAGAARYPLGLVRLADDPALSLIIVVAEDQTVDEAAPEPIAPEPMAAPPVAAETAPAETTTPEPRSGTETSGTASARDDWYFSDRPRETKRAPVRFVWRTDAEGRFSALSSEFAEAVGPQAADVIGKPFREVAASFGFDRSDEIADLLERRDTWSGRSVLWPIPGTGRRVPVDLAALPAYSRDRTFEGFRGFGVARLGDLVDDPDAIEIVDREPPAGTPAPADPFRGETPAIVLEGSLQRRQADRALADKVIRLAEHRAPIATGSLSATERNAFREIGDRLKEIAGPAPGDDEAAVGEAATEAVGEDAVVAQINATAEDGPVPADRDVALASNDDTAAANDDMADTTVIPTAEPAAAAPSQISAEPALPFPPPTASADDDDMAAVPEGLTLLNRLPLPLLVHSGDRLHFASGEFLTLTGYDSLDQLREAGGLDALIGGPHRSGGDGESSMLKMRKRSGEEFAAEGHLHAVPWRGGKALMLALRTVEPIDGWEAQFPPASGAAAAETPEAREMRFRLREMEAIVDTATDGLAIIGEDGTILSISRPAEALFGYDSAEVEGKPFQSLFAFESQRAVIDYLSGLSDNGVASVLNDGREVIGRESQGRFIPLFMTIGRLPDRGGFCAVFRDITQWKRAEEELTQARAQAERASSHKSDFLARISHEIRTPLNAIIGFSELMMDEKFGPVGSDRYRDYLRDINRSGTHVLDLVNDLLDISKIEAGEQEMANEAVSLNEALGEAVALMQPQANRERVIIRSSFSARLPEVVADLRSIRQIALNLLSNAIRYTQAGGQVIVSTAYEGSGDVVMRVRDTGVGMTHAEIEQALKPFKQINALKRARGDGTGLGLPLTKAMVEANRARFAISSTPSEGTMVEVTFPSTRVLAG